jgi:hypothetical protein
MRLDFDTKVPLMAVDVALTQPGLRPETVTVSVPETGIPNGLVLGLPVKATELVLRSGTGKNGRGYAMFSARALAVMVG